MTPGQLAALYANGDPGLPSQSQGYVNDQASRMGITGGVDNYFANQRQDAWNQRAAAQGRNIDLARIAGVDLSPDAARNAQIDQASALAAQQAQQVATLQRQRALSDTALPSSLDPIEPDPNNTLERAGITPEQRAFTSRLGGVTEGQKFIGKNTSALDPEDLTRDPRFASLLNQAPDKASQVFAALTGGSLKDHLTTQAARVKDQDRFGMDTVQDWLKTGRAHYDPGTNTWKMRQLVPSLEDPTKLVVGAGYEEPDPFQAETLKKYAPQVAPMIAERQQLMQRKLAATPGASVIQTTSSASTDPLEKYSNSPLGYQVGNGIQAAVDLNDRGLFVPQAAQDFTSDTLRTVGNFGAGIGNLFGANLKAVPPVQAEDTGTNPIHARQTALMHNPRFQRLLQTDPQSARRIIMSIQQGDVQ